MMKFINIVGLIIVLMNFSCAQRNSKSKVLTEKIPNQQLDWDSGLRIKNGLIQRLSYTNSLGIEYGYAYKTITIYNDSTISIHLQMNLSREYNFPAPYSDQKFKIFIWPQELSQNEAAFTDNQSNELQNFLQNEADTTDSKNISIAPNKKYVLTIGRLFEKPTNYYVSPNVLYVQNDGSIPRDCENLINQNKSTNDSTLLDLGSTVLISV